ncbi:cytochrome c oxidase subunit 3 [Methylocystis sp. MJC1]|jgi:cytochrome c oxidase subunit 3|uniref:cytochrome c oxidase subunit 3 n=1 Tax=Methylocystis sp. MJC1 TaxID=2654282 RepID=UPI0013ED97EC|nr:cytochrome c oxidase subunit 3 [Methylocystis sp. MJC1]KAF2989879.1 Cytochrome bo(3) ubiquinol oxidase subunit 3 [Methylocystis sp. MJC1]MBU6528352.1 cytochrome c oxidase subunit 3 [Methylocystis sp. MJC1]UZX11257.1 cytochrome c oxidase subunit 3 [Methylocystis sp. MJC1]
MSEAAELHDFQYSSADHQRDTAVDGMWAFLATEALFFGPLFLSWGFSRYYNVGGFDYAAAHTNLFVGTLNTILLITSSFAYSAGVAFFDGGRRRLALLFLCVAWALGLAFMSLKFGVEWPEDLRKGFFPGSDFSIGGALRGGAALFFTFYFIGTGIHGLHLFVGLLLLGWVILTRLRFPEASRTPMVIISLYWSFVDIVWLILYPLIYLVGRGA